MPANAAPADAPPANSTGNSTANPASARQPRAEARRGELLAAATRLFAERGYAAAGMDEIARAAETSKGGLYFHFPNKQALLAAVIGRAAELLRKRVAAAMSEAGENPVARSEAALAALFRTLAKHRSLSRVLAAEALAAGPEVRARIERIEDEFIALIAAELRRARDLGLTAPLDPELAARAWFGMVRACIGAWAGGRISAPPRELEAELRRLLLRSAGAAAAAGRMDDQGGDRCPDRP